MSSFLGQSLFCVIGARAVLYDKPAILPVCNRAEPSPEPLRSVFWAALLQERAIKKDHFGSGFTDCARARLNAWLSCFGDTTVNLFPAGLCVWFTVKRKLEQAMPRESSSLGA